MSGEVKHTPKQFDDCLCPQCFPEGWRTPEPSHAYRNKRYLRVSAVHRLWCKGRLSDVQAAKHLRGFVPKRMEPGVVETWKSDTIGFAQRRAATASQEHEKGGEG